MTESSNLPNRVERLENDMIDIKVAVSALISTTEVHQRNIETISRNIETMNRNMETTNRNIDAMLQLMTQSLQRMEVMELDIRGLQTENRRILDILQNRNTDDA
jgi:prefoldin subunit 5